MSAAQYELALPPRPTDDILREQLADLIEQFNASTVPEARVHLHLEIQEFRQLLQAEGRA